MDACSIDLPLKVSDTYSMNIDKDIVDNMQVTSLAYNLYRKYGPVGTPREILQTALRWAELLGMEEWQGHEAYRVWLEM